MVYADPARLSSFLNFIFCIYTHFQFNSLEGGHVGPARLHKYFLK